MTPKKLANIIREIIPNNIYPIKNLWITAHDFANFVENNLQEILNPDLISFRLNMLTNTLDNPSLVSQELLLIIQIASPNIVTPEQISSSIVDWLLINNSMNHSIEVENFPQIFPTSIFFEMDISNLSEDEQTNIINSALIDISDQVQIYNIFEVFDAAQALITMSSCK